jgi:hypothetical protein
MADVPKDNRTFAYRLTVVRGDTGFYFRCNSEAELLAEIKRQLPCEAIEIELDGESTKPVEPDWIEWSGGECPVANDVLVDAKYRNGRIFIASAWLFRWTHFAESEDEAEDIIAYRICKPERKGDQ